MRPVEPSDQIVVSELGKRYGLVGKVFNFFSKLRGGMEKNVTIELKAV